MTRLFIILAIAAIASFTLLGCASSGNAPQINPDARAAIEVARSIGRAGITIALQQHGVPASVTTLALAELDASVINPALDGGTFSLAADPAAWKPVRDELVSRASASLVKSATSNGVPLLDEATAKVLVGTFIDTIAAQVKALTPPKAHTEQL
jgi:hypothetical protein